MTGVAARARVERKDITAALAARLVAEQFPQWADLPVRPVEHGGWDNVTFRLGDEMSLRLPSGAAYAAQVAKEWRWLPFLAPQLPVPIPEPVAVGEPGQGYPWPWTVHRWRHGDPATVAPIADLHRFAVDLAAFLVRLRQVDPTGGPLPGDHNFHRGGALAVYDAETRSALRELGDEVDGGRAEAVWDEALGSTWDGRPVWAHGDVSAGNLLVVAGRLGAVIDFGCCAVGDPACDTVIAWTMLDRPSRATFRAALAIDDWTWARGRGWTLWKAVITLAAARSARSPGATAARHALGEVLQDAGAHGRHGPSA
jgi:aminoglycoside phosphotransferase (APT) family kinase protein